MDVDRSLHIEDQNEALHSAALLVSDRLAETVKGLEPPEREVFELPEVDASLPRVVFIPCLRSPEHYSGSLNAHWTAIYGLTRQTPPWVIHPNEILDGAISFCGPNSIMHNSSWVWVHNPVVRELYRNHGESLSFAGCIPIRTRWSSMPEKELTALQAAKTAEMLGAKGAIVTSDSGGNDYMEVIRTVQACEHRGIETVFMTREEPVTSGVPILEPAVEADAIISTGIYGLGGPRTEVSSISIPGVERVIGKPTLVADTGAPERWDGAPASVTVSEAIDAKGVIPRLAGADVYGFGRRSGFEY
jgi:glycine reductase